MLHHDKIRIRFFHKFLQRHHVWGVTQNRIEGEVIINSVGKTQLFGYIFGGNFWKKSRQSFSLYGNGEKLE